MGSAGVQETLWEAIGPLRIAINTAGEDAVRQFRQPDGTYRQENVFRYVIARRPAR